MKKITDKERIDALSAYVRDDGALLLWNGKGGKMPQPHGGLSFGSGRDIRAALDVLVETHRAWETRPK